MHLSIVAMITGMILGAIYLPWLLAPAAAGRCLAGFPRNLLTGRILATIAVAWFTGVILTANINWVEQNRGLTCLLAAAGWILIITLMDDLLAVRALGGLMMLAPLPILNAAFMEATAWRLVMTVLAYIMAIEGMALVWSPYLFRKIVVAWTADHTRCRLAGGIGTLLGAGLVLLGLTVYA